MNPEQLAVALAASVLMLLALWLTGMGVPAWRRPDAATWCRSVTQHIDGIRWPDIRLAARSRIRARRPALAYDQTWGK